MPNYLENGMLCNPLHGEHSKYWEWWLHSHTDGGKRDQKVQRRNISCKKYRQFLSTPALSVLHAVIFAVAAFKTRPQEVCGSWEGKNAIPKAAVFVFLLNVYCTSLNIREACARQDHIFTKKGKLHTRKTDMEYKMSTLIRSQQAMWIDGHGVSGFHIEAWWNLLKLSLADHQYCSKGITMLEYIKCACCRRNVCPGGSDGGCVDELSTPA